MVCALLLTFGSAAEATKIWVPGNVGNWSDTANWGGTLPITSETAQINTGTATLDASQTIGQLLMGDAAATDVGVLNINSGANLTVSKASAELIGMVKIAGASATINHSAGTVSVFQPGYTGLGETRLVTASGTTGTAIYNLSGTAILDTEVLSKGNKANASAQFNATGGTLVLRNMIYRFGLISENGVGFNQGLAKLEIGAIGTVKAVSFGNATNALDYTVNAGGTMVFDIAGAASSDTIMQYGTLANTLGATLKVNLLGGYTPTVGQTFDVWTFSDKTKAGGGAFVNPVGWTSAWVDTSADGSTDTLRLTYVPEPATIALLGLGLLAMRRNRK
jgi:hypothetical protein